MTALREEASAMVSTKEPDASLAGARVAPRLSVTDLRLTSRRDGRSTLLVDGVDLRVAPGEALGIVGESGSGKSLTLRAIAGILPASVARTGGDIALAAGQSIGMVFQEPLAALSPTLRIGDLLADGVAARSRMRRRAARERAVELLREVGVPEPERRARQYPHQLSGGLRQRVVIAMALAGDPGVLLCDEPTTALDVSVQDQILGLIDRLRIERDLSVVFVSHDLAVVASMCGRVMVMTDGRVVESGPTAEVLQRPTDGYTQQLIAAARAKSGTPATPESPS